MCRRVQRLALAGSETGRRMNQLQGAGGQSAILLPEKRSPGMPKTVLVAGATGLVGYACLKHFAASPAAR